VKARKAESLWRKIMRVLNLEDNALKHTKIERVVRSCGVTDLAWARNFEDGMEMLDESVDLIITDMQFPMQRGAEDNPEAGERVIEEVRKRGLSTRVIVCSSVKYRIPEADGCVWYSDLSEWQQELKKLILSPKSN
jgi:CheY-like chemotaxis protein